MKTSLLFLLLINLFSFIIFGFFPELYITLPIFILCFAIFSCYQCTKLFKQSEIKKEFFIYSTVLTSIFLCIIYIVEIRWSINPFGMIDAYAMWVGKGRVIALGILNQDPIPLWNSYWRMPNYPLGIPFLHANISIVFPETEKFITLIKLPNYFFLFIVYIFLLSQVFSIKHKYGKIIFLMVAGAFLFQPNYLLVNSDLCADFPVSVLIALVTYFLLELKEKKTTVWLILTASLLINIKSEALIISFISLIFMFGFLLSYKENLFKPFILSLLLFAICASPTWYLIAKGSFLSTDFKDVSKSTSLIEFLFNRIFNTDVWALIIKYATDSYFVQTKGLTLILTFLFLLSGSKKVRIISLYYILCVSVYSFIFLLTSLDPETHLEQAYARIHLQLFLIPLAIFSFYIKENEENILTFVNSMKLKFSKIQLQKKSI